MIVTGWRELIAQFKRVLADHLEIFLELRTLSYAVTRQDCYGNLYTVFLGTLSKITSLP